MIWNPVYMVGGSQAFQYDIHTGPVDTGFCQGRCIEVDDQRRGTHEPRFPNHRWWGTFQFNKNESVPAFGSASGNDDPRSPKGQINATLEWSARENDFAPGSTKDDILDEEQRWEMNLRSTAGNQTADVTPRRCQRFRAEAGRNYRWGNWSYADPQQPVLVAAGKVQADRYDLVTVPRVAIGAEGWGNRLVITAIP